MDEGGYCRITHYVATTPVGLTVVVLYLRTPYLMTVTLMLQMVTKQLEIEKQRELELDNMYR